MSPQRLFAFYNRRYFGNQLPLYRIRRKLPARLRRFKFFRGGEDKNGYSWAGYCDSQRHIIYLRQRLTQRPWVLRAIMIHEMTHAAGIKDHGVDFFQKLLDLACAGCGAAVDAIAGEGIGWKVARETVRQLKAKKRRAA